MPRSLLPPKHVEMPTALLYNRNISPAIKDTWAQLRGLAWGKSETPEISAQQFKNLTGKSPSTLYEHMRLLGSWGALSWQPTEKPGIIKVRFPDNDVINSNFSEMPNQSLTALINPGESQEKREIPNFRKVGMENRRKPDAVPAELLKPIIQALSDVTNMDLKLNYSRLAKEAKAIHLAGYSAEQILGIYGEDGIWWEQDWRGQKGEQPQLGHIKLTIQGFVNSNGTVKSRKSKGDKTSPDARKKYAEWGS